MSVHFSKIFFLNEDSELKFSKVIKHADGKVRNKNFLEITRIS